MDEAERIAREAHAEFRAGAEFNPSVWIADKVAIAAARLGIEHGERASAAKIADMMRTLGMYAQGWKSVAFAQQCLARNFPAPKPSLREAAQAIVDGGGTSEAAWAPNLIVSVAKLDALRDALAREEGKP